jgi:hypothetical protein
VRSLESDNELCVCRLLLLRRRAHFWLGWSGAVKSGGATRDGCETRTCRIINTDEGAELCHCAIFQRLHKQQRSRRVPTSNRSAIPAPSPRGNKKRSFSLNKPRICSARLLADLRPTKAANGVINKHYYLQSATAMHIFLLVDGSKLCWMTRYSACVNAELRLLLVVTVLWGRRISLIRKYRAFCENHSFINLKV